MSRRGLCLTFLAFAVALAMVEAACVGDDPTAVVSGDASSAPEGSTGADASTDSTDAGTPDSIAPFKCADSGPPVFKPSFGNGPFCVGAGDGGSNHCALGEHCCLTPGAANTCASACPGTSTDVACFSAVECPDSGTPQFCCGTANVDTTTCQYPIVSGFRESHCAASCTGSVTLCFAKEECGALGCVGAPITGSQTTLAICH